MFADPLTFNLNAVAQSLLRVSVTGNAATYRKSDGLLEVVISHTRTRRERSVFRFNQTKVAADALQPSTNVPYNMSFYVVADLPLFGFSTVEKGYLLAAMASVVADSGYASKFIGGES